MGKRPTKTIKWINKLAELLEDEKTTLLSDTDMFYLVNSELPEKDRISRSKFNDLMSPGQSRSTSIANLVSLSEEEKKSMLDVLNLGRVRQKMNLTDKAMKTPNGAYPYLWMLERKNKELQLNKGQQEGSGNVTLNITVGSEDHKGIIEDILSGTIDIPHEEVNDKKLLDDGKSV